MTTRVAVWAERVERYRPGEFFGILRFAQDDGRNFATATAEATTTATTKERARQ
jgi:hypothetical protein